LPVPNYFLRFNVHQSVTVDENDDEFYLLVWRVDRKRVVFEKTSFSNLKYLRSEKKIWLLSDKPPSELISRPNEEILSHYVSVEILHDSARCDAPDTLETSNEMALEAITQIVVDPVMNLPSLKTQIDLSAIDDDIESKIDHNVENSKYLRQLMTPGFSEQSLDLEIGGVVKNLTVYYYPASNINHDSKREEYVESEPDKYYIVRYAQLAAACKLSGRRPFTSKMFYAMCWLNTGDICAKLYITRCDAPFLAMHNYNLTTKRFVLVENPNVLKTFEFIPEMEISQDIRDEIDENLFQFYHSSQWLYKPGRVSIPIDTHHPGNRQPKYQVKPRTLKEAENKWRMIRGPFGRGTSDGDMNRFQEEDSETKATLELSISELSEKNSELKEQLKKAQTTASAEKRKASTAKEEARDLLSQLSDQEKKIKTLQEASKRSKKSPSTQASIMKVSLKASPVNEDAIFLRNQSALNAQALRDALSAQQQGSIQSNSMASLRDVMVAANGNVDMLNAAANFMGQLGVRK
jgi:hypothetical protein